MWTWGVVLSFCQVNDKKEDPELCPQHNNTLKKWSPQSLKTNAYFTTIIDWGEIKFKNKQHNK